MAGRTHPREQRTVMEAIDWWFILRLICGGLLGYYGAAWIHQRRERTRRCREMIEHGVSRTRKWGTWGLKHTSQGDVWDWDWNEP
jgi:hypothetical protein